MDALRHSFPAHQDALPALLDFVEQGGHALGLPVTVIAKLLLIIEELFTNTCHHGCGPDSGTEVWVQLGREHNEVALHFEDCGAAYNPFENLDRAIHEASVSERPVGRLGILLIEGLASRVHYERIEGHNCIAIWLRYPY